MHTQEKTIGDEPNFKIEALHHLKKLHREQTHQLQEGFLTLEDNCKAEIRAALKEDLSHELKLFLGKAIAQSVSTEFEKQFPSLFKKTQEDLNKLSHSIIQTQSSLAAYQERLSLKWSKPFLLILLACSLTGSFLGLELFLMQTSPLAVLLMDPKSREIFTLGDRLMKYDEKLRAKKEKRKATESAKKKQTSQKRASY